jgi:hypothetical protein
MLHRVMPWLWRLADEDCQQHFAVPQELRDALIAALANSPCAEDPQVQCFLRILVCANCATCSCFGSGGQKPCLCVRTKAE